MLLALMFFASTGYAFHPADLVNAEIKLVKPCNQYTCAVVEKDGKQYLVVGELVDEEGVVPIAIYVVEDKKLRLIWSISWRDT